MDAIVFSFSGSFRDDLDARQDAIGDFTAFVRERYDMEVGLVADDGRADTEEAVDTDTLGIGFVIGDVEHIRDVLGSLAQKYDKVFFVSDIRAELVAVNQSGAYTIGYNSANITADELSGVGPNYIVDSLDELRKILSLEMMDSP
jgi:phosphoglycolate phosphatase-like HAD superfamily hydrolase